MKRFFIALAVFLTVQAADAQVKTPEAAKKAVEAAEAASLNPKKADKVATWLKLAQAYMDAYNAPAGNAWVGASRQELQIIMGSETPAASETVVISGEALLKETYSNKELYYNQNGQLVIINITRPVYDNALAKALEAYGKAYEVDIKKSKLKDITAGIGLIEQKYFEEASNAYNFGDLKSASNLFGKAAEAAATEPLAKIDTLALYDAGFTSWAVQDYVSSRDYFEKCLAVGYYYEDGEVFAKLADVYKNLGDTNKSAEILETGFVVFPQSQSILIGLINYYIESGEDTDRLFVLINEAKKNEPNNASLYYVEGNIYNQLGNSEKAAEAYYKCAEINPDYEYGFIGAGVMFYNKAIDIQEQAANEYDDKKWEALSKEFETVLLSARDPFEKAYEISKDEALKVNIAEYLKNIYYRFRDKGAEFEDGYNKYDAVVKASREN